MIVCVHVIDIAITMRTNAVHGLSLILEEQGQMEEVVERVSMCMCKTFISLHLNNMQCLWAEKLSL